MIGVYYVGSIPSRPMVITVLDDKGRPVDLSMYTDINVRMVGSDNEDIDLSNATVQVTNRTGGKVTFYWPTKSVFTKPGEYVMQVELGNGLVKDFTTENTLLVKQLGGRR